LGSRPDPEAILAAAGVPIDLVAIDMPLSMVPIVGRRISDNLISSLYGSRHAGTHTPSSIRPGKLSDQLRVGFDEIGFPLLTSRSSIPALIEVYPHPALIELAAAARRLPYKHGKAGKYWPEDTPAGRRQRLFGVWTQIVGLLDKRIEGVAAALPMPTLDCRGHEMKAFEDSLDAVICAWVGTCVLDGKARPYGDTESAIWIPQLSAD
jgi:predicted RNase H-like nuclease